MSIQNTMRGLILTLFETLLTVRYFHGTSKGQIASSFFLNLSIVLLILAGYFTDSHKINQHKVKAQNICVVLRGCFRDPVSAQILKFQMMVSVFRY